MRDPQTSRGEADSTLRHIPSNVPRKCPEGVVVLVLALPLAVEAEEQVLLLTEYVAPLAQKAGRETLAKKVLV